MTRKPSVLYLSFNVGFLDPTRSFLLSALREAADVRVFGPGYVAQEELDRTPQAIVDEEGPFDFVMTDEYVIQSFEGAPIETIRFENHACGFDRSLLRKAIEWRDFFHGYEGRRVITLMQSDYYNFRAVHIDRLLALGDYFICWGQEFLISRNDVQGEPLLPGGVNESILKAWNDNFRNFTIQNAERIISCPQFVHRSEVGGGALTARRLPWAVLGADYDRRVEARQQLDGAGVARSGTWMPNAFALAQKVGVNLYSKYWSLGLLRWGFRRALRQARYAFTCGSNLRWPIRKFFEVPAQGCVMVCEPPEGFAHLGFVDDVNALTALPGGLLDLQSSLEGNLSRAQRIADAGRALILEKHEVSARSRQIGAALTLIRDGHFVGSRWQEGDFLLIGQPGSCDPPNEDEGRSTTTALAKSTG